MQVPGIIKNTGIVSAGFNKYLIDGFRRGIPPTEATLMKKNPMLSKVKQKPMEYMSLLLKRTISLMETFDGITVDPIKNATNPIIRVMTKLVEGGLIDKSKNMENNSRTISGWNKYFFRIMFLFKNPKKSSLG